MHNASCWFKCVHPKIALHLFVVRMFKQARGRHVHHEVLQFFVFPLQTSVCQLCDYWVPNQSVANFSPRAHLGQRKTRWHHFCNVLKNKQHTNRVWLHFSKLNGDNVQNTKVSMATTNLRNHLVKHKIQQKVEESPIFDILVQSHQRTCSWLQHVC